MKVKLLLEEVVSGYSAEKDIVDPVWNQNRLINADDSIQVYVSGGDKPVH